MKNLKLFILLMISINLSTSCGKPTTPEDVVPEDNSGGYKIVSRFQVNGYAQDVVKKDDLAYIAQGEGGLMIVNIADPTNPQSIASVSEGVRGYSSNIAIKDSVVYIAAGSFGVTVVNVADSEKPEVTASNLSMKPAKSLHVMGDYLFTAISEQGVKIASISYATQPDPRSGISTSGYAHGIANTADSNYLLVACGEMGLSIFNISFFDDGFGNYPLIGWCDTPGYAESVTVMNDKSIAFLACGTAGLQIIDFSDSTNVHIVGSYDGSGYAKELIYNNNRIYMTTETAGFQAIDVSDFTNPTLIGRIDTEFALGLEMDDNYIYVADEDEGLIIISKPD